MKNNTSQHRYTFGGKTYEIIEEPKRGEQLLRDFKHCEETKDWITIKNRITNGLMWGWLKEVDYVIGDNKTPYKDKWERGKEEGFNKEVDGFW